MPVCFSGCGCFDCGHACAAQPSATLDGVSTAQQGVWSLGLQGGCGDYHVSCRTARKRRNRLEGESEVVGKTVLGTQRTSEETRKNRRRGRDVVREREGEKEPGGSEMKFEGQTFD